MDNKNGAQPQNQMPPAAPPPMQPPPQMPPQPPMQPLMNYNLPPKKSNAGMIAGIIGGIVLLVGIAVSVIVFMFMFSGPTKEDYKDALAELNVFIDKYNESEIENSANGKLGQYEKYKASAEKAKELKKAFKSRFDSIGKNRAVTNDKDVEAAYERAQAELIKTYIKLDTIIEINERVLPVLSKTSTRMNAVSSARTAKEAVEANKIAFEDTLKDLKFDSNKKIIKDMVSFMERLLEVLSDNRGSMTEVGGKINKAIVDFRQDINAILKFEAKDDIVELRRILQEKANK